MSPKRPARKLLRALCADVHEDDGVDPRDLFKKYAPRRTTDRKDRQLCGQVTRALALALAEEADDDLGGLVVSAVDPAPDASPLALVDGCGVGRRNYVTARAVSQLLLGMHREKDWRVYYASLPIAGVDGTLKSRLKGTRAENNVHAKTGTLGGVRALSGYFTGRSGKLYVFSLLMNNFPGTARQAGGVQDDFLKRVLGVL